MRHQTELAQNVAALKAAGVEPDLDTLHEVSGPIAELKAGLKDLAAAIAHEHPDDALAAATYCRDELLPPMATVRAAADTLEGLVADDLWSLPTYQEMLYIL